MAHFTTLNRHGELSVLGRVNPAAAPADILQPREIRFFNKHIPLELSLRTNPCLSVTYWEFSCQISNVC